MENMSSKQLTRIPIDKIVIPEVRAGSELTEEQRALIEASVRKYGVLQPILVRKIGYDQYELIAGKTRLEEERKAGKTEVDAIVLDATDKDAMLMHLIENLARGKTNPIDEARVFQKFLQAGGTIDEIVRVTGHSEDWVQLRLLCLKLPDEYQQALREGKLKLGHIREAIRLPSPEELAYCLDMTLRCGWTVEQTYYYVERRLSEIQVEKAKGEMERPPELPTAEKASAMANLRECSACKRLLDVQKIRYSGVCDECLILARYITDQLGYPKDAMQKIYQAFDYYARMQEAKQKLSIQEQPPAPQAATPSAPEAQKTADLLPEKPLVLKDERLRATKKTELRNLLRSVSESGG